MHSVFMSLTVSDFIYFCIFSGCLKQYIALYKGIVNKLKCTKYFVIFCLSMVRHGEMLYFHSLTYKRF